MPCAVILTAIPVEYKAVRSHLTQLKEEIHPQGTIYERGIFTTEGKVWDVGIVETGAGNSPAGIEAERAMSYFKPDVILFVGVAGGIKDVQLGDVVAGTKVYGYESGKVGETFQPRPDVGLSTHDMIQRARAEGRKEDWLARLSPQTNLNPKVWVEPIAAGEKVVANIKSDVFNFLQQNYSDAIAVEMEGRGVLQAAHANQQVSALIIRGISDLIDGKSEADASGYQEIAARHASAFAFQVLAKFDIGPPPPPPPPPPEFIYINRHPLENLCCQAIERTRCLLRITAPQKMGKTLLLDKILDHAQNKGYKTVRLSLNDEELLRDPNKFYKWFCEEAYDQGNLSHGTLEYWKGYTLKGKANKYFQKNLLPGIESAIVIVIDDFQKSFQYDQLCEQFCLLLREWFENGGSSDKKGKLWSKLRLILVTSTEDYPDFDVNHSPFNVGIPVNENKGLKPFTKEQVLELFTHYQLNHRATDVELQNLIDLLGGHPYMIQEVFNVLKLDKTQSLQQVVDKLPTEESILIDHLRKLLNKLNEDVELKKAYCNVIKSHRDGVEIYDTTTSFKLKSLGLIKFSGNNSVSAFEIYRLYFEEKFRHIIDNGEVNNG